MTQDKLLRQSPGSYEKESATALSMADIHRANHNMCSTHAPSLNNDLATSEPSLLT